MRCEREWEAELRGKTRAKIAGTQQVQRHVESRAGNSAQGLARKGGGEEGLQLEDILWEGIAAAAKAATKRARGELVTTRCAAKAQIDAARVERLERAELLRNDERGMIGQHDSAGTDANAGG